MQPTASKALLERTVAFPSGLPFLLWPSEMVAPKKEQSKAECLRPYINPARTPSLWVNEPVSSGKSGCNMAMGSQPEVNQPQAFVLSLRCFDLFGL